MKAINRIKLFFTEVNYPLLGKSLAEVMWLTLFSLLPLIINIIIAWIEFNCLENAFKTKIIPGEILSYCLSFLAPSLYLLTKAQGSSYKLPLLHAFSITTLFLYVSAIVLYLITKNKWVTELNMEPNQVSIFFKITLYFFLTTIVFRIYSVYHGRNMSNFSSVRRQQQDDFNLTFKESLNND